MGCFPRWRPEITKEQIARARAVPLLEYLKKRGYELKKDGRYYRMVEHDSLVIDPQKNYWHWNSRGIRCGSTPDFLHLYEGKTFEEAVLALLDEQPVQRLPQECRSPPASGKEKRIPAA